MSGFAYRVTADAVEEITPRNALECAAEFVWIHLTSRDEEVQAWLRDHAALDHFTIDALTALETRPRCEQIDGAAVLNLRGMTHEEMASSDPLASIRLRADGARVISVTRLPLDVLDTARAAMEAGRISDAGDLIATLASAITEQLDPEVAQLGDSLDECEEQLDPRAAFDLRRNVSRVRRRAIGYRRFLYPQRAALEKLAGLPVTWLSDEDRLHVSAAADRAARMAEELESIRERAALIHEALTDLRAEVIDQRSLLIAVVAMIFLPLTFITGLFGMNVDGIPYAHHAGSFWIITGFSLVIAAGVGLYFVRRHWFR
ncbi:MULTISPECIES: CorA family divalent cation transporter [unclassified Sphingomonas]|uniref:CorA family divalent cation transporter n=1 Tax=unclassified Sphingomonas TaxID=196159 RepID=UPI0021518408|nr:MULTISPECIES: CorA family divalent cation transporter [unclassified Sphingomonas]MCR5870533.1 zinc transporter ZntB [Sphingomonas sp. J344]UUY01122.1 zinc transporter ZntB [Sphingomonas sp. J315]